MARGFGFHSIMSLFRATVPKAEAVAGDELEEAAAAPAPDKPAPSQATVKLREAFGVNVDADDHNWRPLTGDSDRDLTPMTRQRMRELSLYLWQSNLLANRMIELPIAYLLAEGVRLATKDEAAQDYLDTFWFDPINRMDQKLPKRVRELKLFGEQCWPAFVNEFNGKVRLGNLDPCFIETVVTDPDNPEQPIGIITKKNKKGVARRYRVIVMGTEVECFTARTQNIRKTFTDGDCFYYSINDLTSVVRGHGTLLAQIDWLDAYEQFLFGEIDRSHIMRSFVWDVTLKGATPEEVKKRSDEITAPKPNSVRVHNDSETWQSLAAELGSYESANSARLFRNHMLSGSTLPEHWFGGGGDVNRATASEMGDPTYKALSMLQRILKAILEDVGRFVVSRGIDPSGKSWIDRTDDEVMPQAIFPELQTRDISTYAAALAQVVTGCASAIDRGLLTELTALRLINAVAGRLGVEIDAEAELQAAKDELVKRREEDSFTEIPEDEDLPDPENGGE
ncbi:hypothetical protein [Dongia deserti]|uniref:hypothetical protein n=1 Tax=Dongia deserti TaxID=2268030 RepID=UPI000E652608|nr:hypothetical protein [Dongia deserti]